MFRVLLMLPAIFSEAQETESPLAFSLLGLAGGLWLSHATLYVGQNNLLLIALILFGFSVFLCVKGQKALIPPVAQLATKRIT